jgi:hypothetical protein
MSEAPGEMSDGFIAQTANPQAESIVYAGRQA